MTITIEIEKGKKKEIRRLRRELAAMPDERFDMRMWARSLYADKARTVLQPGVFNVTENVCGTAACLAGHVVARDRGLRVIVNDDGTIRGFEDGKGNPLRGQGDIEVIARNILGLSVTVAAKLFRKVAWPKTYETLAEKVGDRRAAIALLDGILAGNVGYDWNARLVEIAP